MHPFDYRPENQLLAALSLGDRDRLFSRLVPVRLEPGQVLYAPGKPLYSVYFPLDSVVSLLYVMGRDASAEIAIIGNDGMVGVGLFMGGNTMPGSALVQCGGLALQLDGNTLKDEFHRNGRMQGLLLRYTQALLTQMAQTAACNRYHAIDQQLARWLLLSIDRLPADNLRMTDELISHMLGMRHEGVTAAAGKLQRSGAIRYRRGHIEVLDRAVLESLCCECYHAIRHETERLKALRDTPA